MEIDIGLFLHGSENENLEYKEIFSWEKIAESIASFSTHKGGLILVGVNDEGVPIGVECDEDDIQKNLVNIQNNMLNGSPHVNLTFYEHEPGKKIVVFSIKEGEKKPYGWKGAHYKRSSSTNKKLNAREITEMDLQSRNLTFDTLYAMIYSRPATIGDLDERKIQKYLSLFNTSRRNKKMQYTNIKNFLVNFDLYFENKIKNSSLLFFGRNISSTFPGCKINFLKYGGDTEESNLLETKKLIGGDIISQIEEIIDMIRANTENKIVMSGLRRIEINQYPSNAIREAVINAVAHRDYSIADSFINVRLFDNRLEIISPGRLVQGLTVDGIKKGGLSKRRNISVCRLLDNIGLMEQSGQGIKNMILSMTRLGLKEPEITEGENYFKIEFFGQDLSSYSKKPLLGLSQDFTHSLGKKEKESLKVIKTLPNEFSMRKYIENSPIKNRVTVKRHLEKFESLGILSSSKQGRFRIFKKIASIN